MKVSKFVVSSIMIIILIMLDIIFLTCFDILYDPLRSFIISTIIAVVFLALIIVSIILIKKKILENLFLIIVDWASFFGLSIMIISSIFTFFIRPAQIDGVSMLNTLHHNDRVLTFIFNYEARKGDVVPIFVESEGIIYVKRVYAVANDKLEARNIDLVNNQMNLYINGENIGDNKMINFSEWRNISNQHTGSSDFVLWSVYVEEGFIIAFGDNWGNSRDSRFHGPFPTSQVRGRVFFIFYGSRFGIIR